MPLTIDQSAQLAFLGKYTKFIASLPPSDDFGKVDNLVLVLQIFRHTLRARAKNKHPSLEWIETMKTGIRMAANFLETLGRLEEDAIGDWQEGQPVTNDQQGLAGILVACVRTLDAEITRAEVFYPEMTTYFQQERDAYYTMRFEAKEARG